MTCQRCHGTGELVVVDPSGHEYSLPCDACELREWIERAMKAEAALVRERRRIRQLRRAVLAWAAQWGEHDVMLRYENGQRIGLARMVMRNEALSKRARDRSHDDE